MGKLNSKLIRTKSGAILSTRYFKLIVLSNLKYR